MKILALDIGGTSIKSGVFSDESLVEFTEFPSYAGNGAQYMVDRVCDYICACAPSAVGISASGEVDQTSGSIAYATGFIPDYTGFPLLDYITRQTKILTVVENDANCAAIGEAIFGAAKGYKNFLCLTYGTGIGAGIFINGQLYRGADGVAGESGHIITHHKGKKCSCTHYGCYETYASTSALVRSVAECFGKKLNGREIFAARNNPQIRRLLTGWYSEVVSGLVSLTHILNPQAIVLGGGFMNQPEIVMRISDLYYSKLIPSFRKVKIMQAKLGNKAGVYGAYVLVKQKLKV